MTKEQKQEVIEALKSKFSQYNNFYITDTENLSVAQITNLRRHCFNKQVEVKVAKNTLIKKALESLDNEKYAGVYDSLHKVTALMFSESPKDPAVIISSFRKEINGEKPLLKAAFLNGDIFVGNDQLIALTKIKTKNELIGEVIGLLQSPIQRVLGALQNRPEAGDDAATTASATEATTTTEEVKTEKAESAPEVTNPEPTADAAPKTKPAAIAKTKSAPEANNPEPTADAAPETKPAAIAKTESAPEATNPEPIADAAPETKPEV